MQQALQGQCWHAYAGRFTKVAPTQKEIFMQSLICNVPPGTELLNCCDESSVPDASSNRIRIPLPGSGGQVLNSHANFGPSLHPPLDEFIESVCNEVHCT